MENTTLQQKKKHQGIGSGVLNLLNSLKIKFSPIQDSEEDELLKMLREAHSQWKSAELYFQTVTEPDLIDYAIYEMEAAKTKYIYLLKQAREGGIRGEYTSQSL